MSEYIHQDDAYEWVDNKRIEFAEQDFAKVQADRDYWQERCLRAEQCVEFLQSKKAWWKR
jgi:hypothetical protein